MSHYETLKVEENANSDDIKKAFRRLASRHHPDKGGDTKEFQKIQEAYDTLSDPEKRQRYDMERRGFGGPDGVRFHWSGGGMDDLFDNFMFRPQGNNDPFHRTRQPRRNKDIKIDMVIPLKETLQSVGKTIQIQTNNGRQETVNISIPRGIGNGNSIKYPGLGDNLFESLPRGDLYVIFHLQVPSGIRVQHTDIIQDLKISVYDAILGTQREVQGLDGKTFLLSIPPGTQNGTKLRIKNQGLYSIGEQHRGNLLVEILIDVPTELDPERLVLLEKLRNGL
jgi:DnaJ-class molecular chaperone